MLSEAERIEEIEGQRNDRSDAPDTNSGLVSCRLCFFFIVLVAAGILLNWFVTNSTVPEDQAMMTIIGFVMISIALFGIVVCVLILYLAVDRLRNAQISTHEMLIINANP